MITPGDEYPLHQTSRPVRDPGTDRNLYDRFFFNGYPHVGEDRGNMFFAVAFGTYPGRNVVDGACTVIDGGIQYNVRGSRLMGDDRLDLRCGPVTVEIVEPLHQLRVIVDDPDSGVSADLLFTSRAAPFEEPHFRFGPGHRLIMDITRLTQNGTWSGHIVTPQRRIEVLDDSWWGCRDRSWGFRMTGERDSVAAPDGVENAGYYWLWAPLNFDDEVVIFDVNELPSGRRWHENTMVARVGASANEAVDGTHTYQIEWKPGTRHAAKFTADLALDNGRSERITLTPLLTFFMSGIGYGHPTWGHGMWVGHDERSHDSLVLADVDESNLLYNHVQILCEATRGSGGNVGMGILEMLIIGPHTPSGLVEIFDMHA